MKMQPRDNNLWDGLELSCKIVLTSGGKFVWRFYTFIQTWLQKSFTPAPFPQPLLTSGLVPKRDTLRDQEDICISLLWRWRTFCSFATPDCFSVRLKFSTVYCLIYEGTKSYFGNLYASSSAASLAESMSINNVCNKRRPLVAFGLVFFAIVLISILYRVRFGFKHPKTEQVIRILCFGDSLTAGSTGIRRKRHPYSITLQQHLDFHHHTLLGRNILPIFEVHNAGIPGERVVDQMFPRLKKILQDARTKYTWVIILGGTNDLSKYRNSSSMGDYKSIFYALVKLHNMAHSYGARTVAITIPDRECMGSGGCYYLNRTQSKVNDLLRDFAAQNTNKVALVDLANEILLPRDERLWGDYVHFNEGGYHKMADAIYSSIKEHI